MRCTRTQRHTNRQTQRQTRNFTALKAAAVGGACQLQAGTVAGCCSCRAFATPHWIFATGVEIAGIAKVPLPPTSPCHSWCLCQSLLLLLMEGFSLTQSTRPFNIFFVLISVASAAHSSQLFLAELLNVLVPQTKPCVPWVLSILAFRLRFRCLPCCLLRLSFFCIYLYLCLVYSLCTYFPPFDSLCLPKSHSSLVPLLQTCLQILCLCLNLKILLQIASDFVYNYCKLILSIYILIWLTGLKQVQWYDICCVFIQDCVPT